MPSWKTVITPGSTDLAGFESDRQDTRICGTLEQVDSDGVVHLRVAIDCLLMLESTGKWRNGEQLSLTLNWKQLEVYAQGG